MADGEDGGRLDRELNELLQELRVSIPGVQVLFAFLLTIPVRTTVSRPHGASGSVHDRVRSDSDLSREAESRACHPVHCRWLTLAAFGRVADYSRTALAPTESDSCLPVR
jgi:hypothetical protein